MNSVMTKRAQGRRRIVIGFRNFKKRYFCLNTQQFYYAKAKNKRPLCRIPINEILAVEKLQEESFKMKNVSHYL
jgi:Ras GTPase-activating protein 3